MTHETAPAPDRGLVAGMAQGEENALRELARRHGPSVYALAYGILVDGADADEVVAETFEYAWRTAAQFFEREVGSVFAWLTAIARSRARAVVQARDWPDLLVAVREPSAGFYDGGIMIRRLVELATAVALPAVLAAQTPQIPSGHARDTAQASVVRHRATHHRGDVVGGALDGSPDAAMPATRAVRATPAAPSQGVNAASPVMPAIPAVPATPGRKAGQWGSHRP
jgi:sigma-70-like protein